MPVLRSLINSGAAALGQGIVNHAIINPLIANPLADRRNKKILESIGPAQEEARRAQLHNQQVAYEAMLSGNPVDQSKLVPIDYSAHLHPGALATGGGGKIFDHIYGNEGIVGGLDTGKVRTEKLMQIDEAISGIAETMFEKSGIVPEGYFSTGNLDSLDRETYINAIREQDQNENFTSRQNKLTELDIANVGLTKAREEIAGREKISRRDYDSSMAYTDAVLEQNKATILASQNNRAAVETQARATVKAAELGLDKEGRKAYSDLRKQVNKVDTDLKDVNKAASQYLSYMFETKGFGNEVTVQVKPEYAVRYSKLIGRYEEKKKTRKNAFNKRELAPGDVPSDITLFLDSANELGLVPAESQGPPPPSNTNRNPEPTPGRRSGSFVDTLKDRITGGQRQGPPSPAELGIGSESTTSQPTQRPASRDSITITSNGETREIPKAVYIKALMEQGATESQAEQAYNEQWENANR